jgi:hypothetical protein
MPWLYVNQGLHFSATMMLVQKCCFPTSPTQASSRLTAQLEAVLGALDVLVLEAPSTSFMVS